MLKGNFDIHTYEVLKTLEEDAKYLGVDRINSTMLLKALLEAEESPLYEALILKLEDPTCFPEMLEETYEYAPHAPREPKEGVEQPQISYKEGEETKTLFFDEDLGETLTMLAECCESKEVTTISDLTAFFVISMPRDVIKVFRTFGINTSMLKAIFVNQAKSALEGKESPKVITHSQTFVIPSAFKSFVRNFNETLEGTPCDISGRDKECKFIWQTLQKKTKRNVVLIGEPGVGKTSIVEKITHDIISGNCPEDFKNFTVLSLDVTYSVAGTKYRGEAEERYSEFVQFLEKHEEVIVFIDEIHLIRGAGACEEGEIDLANALKPILAGGKCRIIGATTSEEYEKYFSKDGAIKRRFRPIKVKEPKMKELYPMLQKSIKTLSEYHGITISKRMVDFIILNAACFDNETCNPDRTKDLIDLSMVVAKQSGKAKVDREAVLANFE